MGASGWFRKRTCVGSVDSGNILGNFYYTQYTWSEGYRLKILLSTQCGITGVSAFLIEMYSSLSSSHSSSYRDINMKILILLNKCNSIYNFTYFENTFMFKLPSIEKGVKTYTT